MDQTTEGSGKRSVDDRGRDEYHVRPQERLAKFSVSFSLWQITVPLIVLVFIFRYENVINEKISSADRLEVDSVKIFFVASNRAARVNPEAVAKPGDLVMSVEEMRSILSRRNIKYEHEGNANNANKFFKKTHLTFIENAITTEGQLQRLLDDPNALPALTNPLIFPGSP